MSLFCNRGSHLAWHKCTWSKTHTQWMTSTQTSLHSAQSHFVWCCEMGLKLKFTSKFPTADALELQCEHKSPGLQHWQWIPLCFGSFLSEEDVPNAHHLPAFWWFMAHERSDCPLINCSSVELNCLTPWTWMGSVHCCLHLCLRLLDGRGVQGWADGMSNWRMISQLQNGSHELQQKQSSVFPWGASPWWNVLGWLLDNTESWVSSFLSRSFSDVTASIGRTQKWVKNGVQHNCCDSRVKLGIAEMFEILFTFANWWKLTWNYMFRIVWILVRCKSCSWSHIEVLCSCHHIVHHDKWVTLWKVGCNSTTMKVPQGASFSAVNCIQCDLEAWLPQMRCQVKLIHVGIHCHMATETDKVSGLRLSKCLSLYFCPTHSFAIPVVRLSTLGLNNSNST